MAQFRGFSGDFLLYRILIREFTINDKFKKCYEFNRKKLVVLDKEGFDKLNKKLIKILDNTPAVQRVNKASIKSNLKKILDEKESYLQDLSRDIRKLKGIKYVIVFGTSDLKS